MYEQRLPNQNRRRAPRDQFRCGGCQRFVRGTEYGVCPNCGLAPPAVTVFGETGSELRRQANSGRGGRLFVRILFAAFVGLVCAWMYLVTT